VKCIDVHCYYGKWGFPIHWMSINDVLAVMETAEAEKAIVMSAQAIQYDFVAGNAELAEAIAPHPDLYGYVYINMHYPELSLQEMEKYLPSDKFVGVKYQGEYSRAAACAPENRVAFDLLEKTYHKPLLLHTWGLPEHGNTVACSLPSQALQLALEHPGLNIVMGHMGGTEWMSAIQAASQAPNLYLDTCASYADRDKVATAVRALGAERVLFGSGMTEGNFLMQKGAILDADITPAEKHQVLYANAQRVFNLSLSGRGRVRPCPRAVVAGD
jgi:predicted TIM-barrel fold metal-dependent hydrolase